MPSFEVTTLDVALFAVYVVGVRVALGWYFARKTRGGGADRYFLAGKELRWPIVGLSFYVANMSGGSFVALPASGYHDGIPVYHYEWIPALLLVLFAVFFVPLFRRARVYTAPEWLEYRFSRAPRLAFSAFTLATSIIVDAAASLYAGGTIVTALYPQVPFWIPVAATSIVAGVYIALGGLGAVVLNDAIQATLILAGGAAIAVLAWMEIPSWSAVTDSAPPGGLHLVQPADDPVLPWPGIVTGVVVIGIYFWCTNQFVIQRALGARSLDHARWGSLFAGLLKLPNLFILILPGVLATALYPRLDDPDLVFPTLAFDLLPVGVRGLMLAALAAAVLSSLEAILNSSATLFTMDFVRSFRPRTRDATLSRTGRVATLAFMVLAAAWAPQIQRFPTLWQYLQSVLSYIVPPVVAVFLVAMFWRRATSAAALVTIAAGVPLGLAGWVAVEIAGVVRIQYLYACGVVFAASVGSMVGVSACTRPPARERVDAHIWQPRLWREDTLALRDRPWYESYRMHALALVGLSAAIVAWWW